MVRLALAFTLAVLLPAASSPAPQALSPTPLIAHVESLLKANPLGPQDTLRVTPLGQGVHASAVLVQLAPNRGIPGHVHRTHDEFVHVVRGSCRARVDERMFDLVPGSVLIVPQDTPHGAVAGARGCAVVSIYAPLWDPTDRVRDARGDAR